MRRSEVKWFWAAFLVLAACGGGGGETSGGAAGTGGAGGSGQGGAGGSGQGGAGGQGQGSGGSGQGGAGGEAPETVACDQCFPFESLPTALRQKAEQLLLEALDTEALYTIAGDLKPMSSGFAKLTFPEQDPTSAEAEDLRTILKAWTCTSAISADVQIFTKAYNGKKYVDGLVFRWPRFSGTIVQYQPFFDTLAITPAMDPLAAVNVVDADPTTKRFRAYGYFFGYPDHAVDFFVAAAEHEAQTGDFVERDFISIPTYASPTGNFVYAVPKGHVKNDADNALAAKAAPILTAYEGRRAQFIGAGKPGVVALLRAWFDDGAGQCAPSYAKAP